MSLDPHAFIDAYEENRATLIGAIRAAGGVGELVLGDGSMSVRALLCILASNHLKLLYQYSPPQPPAAVEPAPFEISPPTGETPRD